MSARGASRGRASRLRVSPGRKTTPTGRAAPRASEPFLSPPRLLAVLLFLGLCFVIVMCAWQSDDAYITFRTARNAWHGHGLTWNPGERVQAYTHPLWMLICLACYGLFREVYYSTLVVSMLFATLASGLIVRAALREPWLPALALLLLGTSGAFVDYATSGLENPLLDVLLVLVVGLARSERSVRRLLWMSLLTSAVGLTRLDALLIVLPATLWHWWGSRREPGATGALVAGLVPLAAWEVFSLVYYGSLVPNTALAKLNVELGLEALVRQGLLYFQDSITHDPVTVPVILVAIGLAFRREAAPYRPLLIGLALYLSYILRIGGDFMSGRFFAAPFVAAVAILTVVAADRSWRPGSLRRLLPALGGLLVVLGLAWPGTRWRSGLDYGVGLTIRDTVRPSGIADERAYYYPTTGLARLTVRRGELHAPGQPFPPYPGAIMGARFARSRQPVAVWDEAGFFGYFSEDKLVVDIWALADPLLARVPYRPAGDWRIGHYPRSLPAGYLETRREGRNRLEDPGLAALYDGLMLVTRGPLMTRARWREVWRLHSGHYVTILRRHSRGGG